MKSLRKLSFASALALIVGVSAFAGETQTPPCVPDPGILETPPCASAPIASDSNAPGELQSPPADGAEFTTTLAMDLVQSMLSIF